MRASLACVLSLVATSAIAAPITTNTYGHELIVNLAKSHSQASSIALIAEPPKTKGNVVVASTQSDEIGAPADPAPSSTVNPAGDRLNVQLALHDVGGDTIGAVRVSYPYKAGADRSSMEKDAEQIRDALHRRISNAGNLLDPLPYEIDAPSNTYAQKLVDEFLKKYPEVEILAIHATAPDSDYNVIVGSNIGRLGKKADNDDMRCVFTGKPNLEINSTGKRFETEMRLSDRAGHVIGAVGVVVAYKPGDDKKALHAHAEKIKTDLEKQIPDAASLFRSADH